MPLPERSQPVAPACHQCALPVPPARRRAAGAAARFCCFGCRLAFEIGRPAAPDAAEDPAAPRDGTLLLRLGAGIFLSMNIMVFSGPFYAREWFGAVAAFPSEYGALESLFAHLLLLLTTLVLALLGGPLAADALSGWGRAAPDGRGRRFGVRLDGHLLIGAGVLAAYAISVAHTLGGQGSLYYDTAAMILVLVTLGNWLEAGARRRATTAAGSFLAALPARVTARRTGQAQAIDAALVVAGDEILARAGETFAVDGDVIEGESRVEEAMLTGESRPRHLEAGDRVLAGSVNLDGPVWVRATGVGAERAIRRMERMLAEARLRQPPVQRLADRVAAWFVPGVIVLALGVLVRAVLQGEAARGLFDGLSVLLIACPCAFGLAAPLATWSALRRAAERGILIDSAATLERAARVGRVCFDKTGTLTTDRPVLIRIDAPPGGGASEGAAAREALRLAAAAEAAGPHPVGRALLAAARERGLDVPVPARARLLPGLGVEARIDGREFALGSERLARRLGVPALPASDSEGSDETTIVRLMEGARTLATFHLAETPRPDAAAALAELAGMGVEVVVLTGDRPGPARRLARELRVRVEASLLPEDKVARLSALRAARGRGRATPVAMVGDGLNDAPVLAAADVGIAMGSAADLARRAGHVHLLHDRLDRVPATLALARDTMRRIRLNLGWAFGYNALGLALAAMGLLTPIFAASTMIVSSLVIIAVSKGAGAGGAHAEPRRA